MARTSGISAMTRLSCLPTAPKKSIGGLEPRAGVVLGDRSHSVLSSCTWVTRASCFFWRSCIPTAVENVGKKEVPGKLLDQHEPSWE